MTPEENAPLNTEQPPRPRRTVRFTVSHEPERPAAPQESRTSDLPGAPHRDRWLRLAERAVGDWAPTLHEALLRVVLFAGALVVLGIAFGIEVALLGAVVGFVTFLVRRRADG
jgi:hypothetical protein